MPRYGFDSRNEAVYRGACWLALATSLLMVTFSLMGNGPDWMVSGLMPAIGFGLSAMVCAIAIKIMPHAAHFRSAAVGGAILSLGLAYLAAGGPRSVGWIMVAAGAGLISIPVILGKHGDRQTPDRTIRIRWPWR